MTQRTLVLLKPDAVRRGLVGEILSRFEAKGLTIVALEHRTIDGDLADRHYAEHVERDFYPPLRDFVTSGPLVAAVCLVIAGLLRAEWGYALGWLVQVAAIGLGFVVPLMFFLGSLFALLWGIAYFLGRKIERERAAAYAEYESGTA